MTGDSVEFIVDMSGTDGLTGVLSRRAFVDQGRHDVARRQRYGVPLSCMILDIDHLGVLNGCHGLAAGDLVLRQVAATCRRFLQTRDYIGRIGDDEFAVMMPEKPLLHAAGVAEQLRKNLAADEFIFCGKVLRFTASIGVAESPKWMAPVESLLEAAGCAVHDAKMDGRNRVGCFFENDLRVSSSPERIAI